MGYWISSWVLILIKSSILVENVTSHLNRVKPTRTTKFFSREETKLIFTNRSMVGNWLLLQRMHTMSLSVQIIRAKDLLWHKKVQWYWSYHQVGWEIVFLCYPKLGRLFSKCWGYHCIRFYYCNLMMFCKDTQVKG